MTVHRRRLLCFALALSLLITLIPSGPGSRTVARAEDTRMGITLDTVNVRYGASTKAKIVFSLPANHVCIIRDEKNSEGIHWYRVETTDPSRKNSNTYFGYIHGDFFRELSQDEIDLYNKNGNVATPTPVPTSYDNQPTPTPTPVPSGKNQDLPAIEGSIGSVTAGGTNLREGPGTGYRSLMRLDRNTQVELLTIPSVRGPGSNTFFKVKYEGNIGYIMSDFISILSGGPKDGNSVVVTPTPVPAPTVTPEPTILGYVRTKVSGCNLRATVHGTVILQIAKNVTLPYILEPVPKYG